MAIKKPNAICLKVATICVALAFAIPASGAPDDYYALVKLITDEKDSRVNAMNLAFLHVTHNLDATPEDDYVIVKQESKIYGLTPNGQKQGLAEITVISDTNSSPG